MVEFFIPMVPPTATYQEHKVMVRNGKPVFYSPPGLKAARAKLTDHLAGYRPETPMGGALELVVKWCFRAARVPESADRDWHEWKAVRPDTDNLQKLLKDCMTRTGFWMDDCQVCREIVEKYNAAIPGIYIRVTELE